MLGISAGMQRRCLGWGGHFDGCFLAGLAGHPLAGRMDFPVCGAVVLRWAGRCDSSLSPFCREKDIEMFLESSRSKFIGYTLGRWVQSQPRAAVLGGLWDRPVWGLLLSPCGSKEGLGWVVHGSIPGWSLPHPWVLSPVPACSQPGSFPPAVTPTPWWACPGPSMRASAP